MKKIIDTMAYIVTIIAFFALCSEPSGDRITNEWILWEFSWFGVLGVCALWLHLSDKRATQKK